MNPARRSRNRNGRHAFHRVARIALGKEWDAVGRVPTGISALPANNFEYSSTRLFPDCAGKKRVLLSIQVFAACANFLCKRNTSFFSQLSTINLSRGCAALSLPWFIPPAQVLRIAILAASISSQNLGFCWSASSSSTFRPERKKKSLRVWRLRMRWTSRPSSWRSK